LAEVRSSSSWGKSLARTEEISDIKALLIIIRRSLSLHILLLQTPFPSLSKLTDILNNVFKVTSRLLESI
jgi:hypothetical protein